MGSPHGIKGEIKNCSQCAPEPAAGGEGSQHVARSHKAKAPRMLEAGSVVARSWRPFDPFRHPHYDGRVGRSTSLVRSWRVVSTRPIADRIAEVERRLAEAKARLPKHSVPATMLIEIEDLEDELARLQEEQRAVAGGER